MLSLIHIFVPAGKASPAAAPRRAVYGRIVSGKTTVDSGICTFFAAPASYTGEDMAEITCHGGVYAVSYTHLDVYKRQESVTSLNRTSTVPFPSETDNSAVFPNGNCCFYRRAAERRFR